MSTIRETLQRTQYENREGYFIEQGGNFHVAEEKHVLIVHGGEKI